MGEINENDFKKLQDDVTAIRIALLGTEFDNRGLVIRMKDVECDVKANSEIISEVVRWKAEAQQWKDKEVVPKLSLYDKIYWKIAGILIAIGFILPFLKDYIKKLFGI